MRNKAGLKTLEVLLFAAILVGPVAKSATDSSQVASNSNVDLTNPDVAAIVQIAKDFEEANKIGDVKRIAEFYSPDVIYMYQGMPDHVGREVIAEMYKDFFSKNNAQVSVHIDEVRICGEMAFDRATFTATATPKAGGEASVTKGRLLEILRKEGGKWKSLRVMVNTEE